MNNLNTIVKTAFAAVGTALVWLFGGWDDVMLILVVAMALDYISGVLKAFFTKALDSKVGAKGIAKKAAILLLVAVAAVTDRAIGAEIPVLRTAVALFLTANELLSVIENVALMGVPVPNELRKALEALKHKNDEGGEKDA